MDHEAKRSTPIHLKKMLAEFETLDPTELFELYQQQLKQINKNRELLENITLDPTRVEFKDPEVIKQIKSLERNSVYITYEQWLTSLG